MKNFRFVIPIVIVGSILTTGCVEIVEKITIYHNRSGSIRYSIEPGKLSALIAGMMNHESTIPMGSLQNQTAGFAEKLGNMEGIDSVEYKLDNVTNEYFLKFSFEKVENLNDALFGILNQKQNLFTPAFVKLNPHRMERKNFVPHLYKYLETQKIDSSFIGFADLINFKTIITVPSRIKSARGENCRMLDDGYSMIQTHKASGIIGNSANLAIRVRY